MMLVEYYTSCPLTWQKREVMLAKIKKRNFHCESCLQIIHAYSLDWSNLGYMVEIQVATMTCVIQLETWCSALQTSILILKRKIINQSSSLLLGMVEDSSIHLFSSLIYYNSFVIWNLEDKCGFYTIYWWERNYYIYVN